MDEFTMGFLIGYVTAAVVVPLFHWVVMHRRVDEMLHHLFAVRRGDPDASYKREGER